MEKNKKRQWIWFRGLIRWRVHWGDFPEHFSRQFPEDEIQMIDFPGFGDFNSQPSPWNMQGFLDHVDQQVKGPGPFHLLGFSLGAMVATHWSLRHPQKVAKQFLINTSDNRSPSHLRIQLPIWPMILRRLINPSGPKVEFGVLQAISNRADVRKKWSPIFQEAYAKVPIRRRDFLAQIRTASQTRFPVQAPVSSVILNSKGDRLAHHSCSEKIARLWDCPIETHVSAGHDLTLDDGPWVLEKLSKYLD